MRPADLALVARDPGLPGLATVLDPVATAALIAHHWPGLGVSEAQIPYVRYKAGASCLTGVEVTTVAGMERFTCKALGLRAEDKWEKARRDGRAVSDATLRIVIRRFPDDGALDGPGWLLEPTRREERMAALGLEGADLDVLAWKPERRFVARATRDGEPVAVIKCHDVKGYDRALAAHHALALVAGVPAMTATRWHDRRCVIVTPWVEGAVLQVATDPLDQLALTGRDLARLHGAPVLAAPAPDVRAEQASLERLAEDVTWCLPDVKASVTRLVARIADLRDTGSGRLAAIHGDFYAKQVLLHPPGLTFLDFDEATLGDPHADLALFIAHVERDVVRGTCPAARSREVVRALLDGYRERGRVDPDRLAWRTAEALLRLTPHPFRHRQADWPATTRGLVARCEAILDGVRARPGVRGPADEGARRLQGDSSLAFAVPLLHREAASRALGLRRDRGSDGDVTVHRATLLRHKPGRRCLIAFDLEDEGGRGPARWLGKVRAKGTDHRGAAGHHALWHAGLRVIAEPLGVVESHRMTLQRAVPGIPLLEAFTRGRDPEAMGRQVATALHALHECPVAPGRTWTVDDEVTTLRDRLTAFREQQPGLQAQAGRVLRRLVDLAGPLRLRGARALLHRDFYHDQVLFDGGTCTLVDLDLMATGDPALDLGNCIGHLLELSWREDVHDPVRAAFATALVDEARALAPARIAEDAVARYTGLALGRLLEIAMHHDDRRPHVPRLLSLLESRLARLGRKADLLAFTEHAACDVA